MYYVYQNKAKSLTSILYLWKVFKIAIFFKQISTIDKKTRFTEKICNKNKYVLPHKNIWDLGMEWRFACSFFFSLCNQNENSFFFSFLLLLCLSCSKNLRKQKCWAIVWDHEYSKEEKKFPNDNSVNIFDSQTDFHRAYFINT